jgi:hypothetical protein
MCQKQTERQEPAKYRETTIRYLSLSVWFYSPLDLRRFFSFLIYTQSVGLLGRGISPRKAAIYTQNAHRHPCLEWDSNPRDPSVRRGEDCSYLRLNGHCDRWL